MRVLSGVILVLTLASEPVTGGNGRPAPPAAAAEYATPLVSAAGSTKARDRADLAARRRAMGPPVETGYRPLPSRTRAAVTKRHPPPTGGSGAVVGLEVFGPPLADYQASLDTLFSACEALRAGADIAHDRARLEACYRFAAEAGDARSMGLLGWLQRSAPDGDLWLARFWYARALAEGYRPDWLVYGLGWLTLHGRGGPADEQQGHHLLRAAAASGYASAQYHVGWNYEEGRGTPVDLTEARRWYEAAAAAGHAEAMTRLGHLYEAGRGVAHDTATARRWYLEAATRGEAHAMFNLGILAERAGANPALRAEADVWYARAAAAGLAAGAPAGNGRAEGGDLGLHGPKKP